MTRKLLSSSHHFALMVRDMLREGMVRSVIRNDHGLLPLAERYFYVCGRLDIGSTFARIEVLIWSRFQDLKRVPPAVACSEPWVKRDIDWHNGLFLCWVNPLEWEDAMNWPGKPPSAILVEGVNWLRDGVTRLLNQHYVAHLDAIETWPPEWPAWSHEGEGYREYVDFRIRKPSALIERSGRYHERAIQRR